MTEAKNSIIYGAEETEGFSINYSCRACNHGFASWRSTSKYGTKREIKVETDPHYCKDDVVVPGMRVTFFLPDKERPKPRTKKAPNAK